MPSPDVSWDRIKQLFTAIAALPAVQRHAAVLAAEATDDERREVLALLAAHPPTEAPAAPSDTTTSHSEGPGTPIGPTRCASRSAKGASAPSTPPNRRPRFAAAWHVFLECFPDTKLPAARK